METQGVFQAEGTAYSKALGQDGAEEQKETKEVKGRLEDAP